MSQVSTFSGATVADLEALRDKACEMGEKTKSSASEAEETKDYIAMAGGTTVIPVYIGQKRIEEIVVRTARS